MNMNIKKQIYENLWEYFHQCISIVISISILVAVRNKQFFSLVMFQAMPGFRLQCKSRSKGRNKRPYFVVKTAESSDKARAIARYINFFPLFLCLVFAIIQVLFSLCNRHLCLPCFCTYYCILSENQACAGVE